MDLVYQEFLTSVLGDAARSFGLRRRPSGDLYLDLRRRVTIDPDIVFVDAHNRIRVGIDAKYKRHDPTSDVYQALAYAKGLGLSAIALVYPEDGEVMSGTHEIINDGTLVLTRTIPVGRGAEGFRDLDRRTELAAQGIIRELLEIASAERAA
jgi:hypothetical protein